MQPHSFDATLKLNYNIIGVFTVNPYSKPVERNVVYVEPRSSMASKSTVAQYKLFGHRRHPDVIDCFPVSRITACTYFYFFNFSAYVRVLFKVLIEIM